MIKITYNLKKHEVKIKGHANSAPMGEDLICAGISTLTVALSRALKEAKSQGLIDELTLDLDDGDTHVKAKPKEEAVPTVNTIFTTILNGYDAMSISFPQYVSFTPIG